MDERTFTAAHCPSVRYRSLIVFLALFVLSSLFVPLPASAGCIGICLNCEICNKWITIPGGTAGLAGSCSEYASQQPELIQSVCAKVDTGELDCPEAKQLCLAGASGGGCEENIPAACAAIDRAATDAHSVIKDLSDTSKPKRDLAQFKKDVQASLDRVQADLCDKRKHRKEIDKVRQVVTGVSTDDYAATGMVEERLRKLGEKIGCGGGGEPEPEPGPKPEPSDKKEDCPEESTSSKPAFEFLRERANTKKAQKGYTYTEKEKKFSDGPLFACMPDSVADALTSCQNTKTQVRCQEFCREWERWLGKFRSHPDQEISARVNAVVGSCTALMEGYWETH